MKNINFPEYLFKYLRPKNIDLGEYSKSGLGIILPNGLILINRLDDPDEQTLTLLHEAIHFHPKFIDYTKALLYRSPSQERNELIEQQIENYAREIKNSRPDIVTRIKGVLEQAKKHPLNQELS